MSDFDVVIRRGNLRAVRDLADVAISEGRIAEISEHIDGEGEVEIDAEGRLLTESFVVPHLHLDKVMTGHSLGSESVTSYQEDSMGGAMTAIEKAAVVKENYREELIEQRARSVLNEARRFGATHIRAFADVDTIAGLKGLRPLLKLREEFADSLRLQVVAFPQQGILRDPGSEEMLHQAMELGADLVGGIPWIEYTDEDARRHIDIAFEMAKQYRRDVAMLVDDAGDPDLRTLEYLALKTAREGFNHRVSACHARAMSLYNEVYLRKLIVLLREAQISIVTSPHTGPLHVPVKRLLEEGIPVALGQDDIYDAYYPYGRCNMLEVAFLASHLLWMMTEGDMETLYDMTTTYGARALALDDHGVHVGKRGSLVILRERNLRDALTNHSSPLHTLHEGSIVHQTRDDT